jgi:branched-chain amino acid transport system substrate-binding protein
MYGVVPSYWWTDTDVEGVQAALAAFEAGGYPETDKAVGYLLSYGSLFAIRDILQHAINLYGFENLSGANFLAAMQDLGLITAGGLYALDVRGENRAPSTATIRRIDLVDGKPTFVTVQDFFQLPDTRPPAP